MTNKQQEFFEKVSVYYNDLIKVRDPKERLKIIVEPKMGARVLDVGNGGVRNFYSPDTEQYVGFDFSFSMLKNAPNSADMVCGDALNLPFRRNTFNTLLYRAILHHLAGKNEKETEQRVTCALTEGFSALNGEGNMVIVEPGLPRILETIERLFYIPMSIGMAAFGIPRIRLFSLETLVRMVEKSGFKEIVIHRISIPEQKWKWVAPVIGLPWLKVPAFLLPVDQIVLEARKG